MSEQEWTMDAVIEYAKQLQRTWPRYRHGQATWLAAETLNFAAVQKLRSADVDPFYSDDRVPAFLDALFPPLPAQPDAKGTKT